jgi:hypothetical protein
MSLHRQGGAVAASLLFAGAAFAGSPPATHRNFVSCPIVRDTVTVPCWLAEHQGELYFLTLQTDVSAPVTPPWLGHRVLVEGVVKKDAPRICGGIVLEPVKLSVLPELDQSCNTILPAEDRYNLTFEPPRPPGPSKGRLAFDRPGRGVDPPQLSGPQEFTIAFDFDGMIGFRHPGDLMRVITYAESIKATHVEVVGYRGAVLLSSGETLTEKQGIAQARAEQIAGLLQGAGLKTPAYRVRWEEKPARVDGDKDYESYRVTVLVKP